MGAIAWVGTAIASAIMGGGEIASGAMQASASENAANDQATANADALAFQKQQAEAQFQQQQATAKANYGAYAAQQGNYNQVRQELGLPPLDIPAYTPLPDPNFTGTNAAPQGLPAFPAPTRATSAPGSITPAGQPQPGAPISSPTGAGSTNLPTFTSTMSPAQVQQAVNQYIAASGVPNTDNGQYWVTAWQQWGSQDPAYFASRLQQGVAGVASGPPPTAAPPAKPTFTAAIPSPWATNAAILQPQSVGSYLNGGL